MKLNASEDIEAPIAKVFETLTDYAQFETAAQRRGAEVERRSKAGKPEWKISFAFRGKLRTIVMMETANAPPNSVTFAGGGKLFEGTVHVELVALGPRRTRMACELVVKPKSLAARLILQSLKLARSRLTKRFRSRLAKLAAFIEERAKAAASAS